MKFLKSRKVKLAAAAVLFFITAVILFFNKDGILKYIKLKNDVDKLKRRIAEVEAENKRLEGEIDSLQKKIPAKIEKTAREKYNMIREGETAIKVVEE